MTLKQLFKGTEPKEFSPWVAKQTQAISKLTGIENLVIEGMEVHTGKGRIDILMKSEDHLVIIENQYGTIDKSHVKRAFEYKEAKGAKHVIMIAEGIHIELVNEVIAKGGFFILAEAQTNGVVLTSVNNDKSEFISDIFGRFSFEEERLKGLNEILNEMIAKSGGRRIEDVYTKKSDSNLAIMKTTVGRTIININHKIDVELFKSLACEIDRMNLNEEKTAQLFQFLTIKFSKGKIYHGKYDTKSTRKKRSPNFHWSHGLVNGCFYTKKFDWENPGYYVPNEDPKYQGSLTDDPTKMTLSKKISLINNEIKLIDLSLDEQDKRHRMEMDELMCEVGAIN